MTSSASHGSLGDLPKSCVPRQAQAQGVLHDEKLYDHGSSHEGPEAQG
jgi:hypothetical protein